MYFFLRFFALLLKWEMLTKTKLTTKKIYMNKHNYKSGKKRTECVKYFAFFGSYKFVLIASVSKVLRLNVQIFSSMHFFLLSISEIYGAFLHNLGNPHVLIRILWKTKLNCESIIFKLISHLNIAFVVVVGLFKYSSKYS